jgi:catechol 2,3-dioxygenase-like lactoylglutathione lyase family enzyme
MRFDLTWLPGSGWPGVRLDRPRRDCPAGHPIVEPITEFVPDAGYFFTNDPDGNWVELAGPI